MTKSITGFDISEETTPHPTEIERLREEVERLRKALGERQQLSAPNLSQTLMKDEEFITDLCRFSEGVYTEAAVRKKYHFTEETWTALGTDDALCERVETEKLRRIRSGATKRELAQLHIIRGPDVLATIMDDPKANARHRVDSIKALDDLADPGPSRSVSEQDRVHIVIDLTADTRAKNPESPINPADVLIIDAAVRPNPNPNNTKIIDSWDAPKQLELNQEEPPPPRRGPGRPPGSKNKPKTTNPNDDEPTT